jgi:hypothetical protein
MIFFPGWLYFFSPNSHTIPPQAYCPFLLFNDSVPFPSLDQVAGPNYFLVYVITSSCGLYKKNNAPPTFSPQQVACPSRSAGISATAFFGRIDSDCEPLFGN